MQKSSSSFWILSALIKSSSAWLPLIFWSALKDSSCMYRWSRQQRTPSCSRMPRLKNIISLCLFDKRFRVTESWIPHITHDLSYTDIWDSMSKLRSIFECKQFRFWTPCNCNCNKRYRWAYLSFTLGILHSSIISVHILEYGSTSIKNIMKLN